MIANRKVYKKYVKEHDYANVAMLEVAILKEILEQKGRKVAIYITEVDVSKEEHQEDVASQEV